MPTALATRGTTRAVAAAARRPALADEGIVVGIVAVTGTEDSVQDIIVPGAFAKTLRERRAKLCWMHDWKLPLGRVLNIVELKPGDKRLPTVLPDGKAWPKAAGAVIATMQFNLRTQQGREFFEHAKAWAINGEAAFSIGYKVVDGMASKRADGVRLIYALDLFEVSLVLHGAHPMALALEVKSAAPFGMEVKDTDGLMQVKAAHAAVLEAKAGIPGVADTPSDEAAVQRLRDSWSHGSMAAKIGWGKPGDFDTCVSLATEHMSAEEAKGWCNLRHHDALGMYPATHAKLEGKTAAAALLEAKSMPVTEGKSMPRIAGSYEERRELLTEALETLLTPKNEKGEREGWLCVEATFDDHVIVSVQNDGRAPNQSWKVPYAVTPAGVELGKPVEVELSIIVSGGEEPKPAETSDAVRMRFIDPASTSLADATRFVAAMPEGKSASELQLPLLTLLDTLAMKGYDMAAVMGDDQYGEDDEMPSEHDQYRGQRKVADDEADEDPVEEAAESDFDEAAEDADEPDEQGDDPYAEDDYSDIGVDEDIDPEDDPDGEGDEGEPDESEQIKLDPEEVFAQIKELLA